VTRTVISEPALLVLASLMSGAKHGYAIICDIEAQTGKRLGPGTLYGIIGRLEKTGLIRPHREQERGRRPYGITPAGRQAFKEQVESLSRYQRALRSLASG
jgi:DNA-binding PadR family transcriptional regulator